MGTSRRVLVPDPATKQTTIFGWAHIIPPRLGGQFLPVLCIQSNARRRWMERHWQVRSPRPGRGVPSPHFRSATTARTFSGPDDISSAFSPSGVRSVTAGARSPPSTFAPYPTSGSPKSPSISQGGTYQAPKCEPSSPSPPNRGSILCSVERPEQSAAPSPPAPAPLPAASLCGAAGQEHLKPVRTLRSVRTRFGDVYAEHEQVEEQGGGGSGGGRWVCQCGSTFVRDSDWERHAMHSLSHSAGGGFDCNLCDISFTRSDAMFRHRRKKHGIRNAPCRGPRESEDEGPQPLSRERQMTRFSMDKY